MIREYMFSVPGFIPGVPGVFPAGSRVTIDEETKEVLSVWPEPVVSAEAKQTPALPPAGENSPLDVAQQLSEAVKNL